ncbi:MAG: hypothetical protein MZU97_21650 [Bacillus subtilis]|nr:hypothetical protein [Bacillus subtilis]
MPGSFVALLSTIVDMVIVFTVLYLSFILAGRQILRDQVPDFDTVFDAYNEVIEAYNADLELAQVAYNAAVELAADNAELEAEALAVYRSRVAVLDEQNVVDIEPFNIPLSGYFLNIIYYFAIGFIIATGIYTVAVKGKTFGRKLLNITLEGPINPITVFLHDVVFKYFLSVLVLVISLQGGLMLLLLSALLRFNHHHVFRRTKRRSATSY